MGNRPCVHCGGRRVCYTRDTKPFDAVGAGLPAPLLRKKLYDAAIIVAAIAMDLSDGHLDIETQESVIQVCYKLDMQAAVALACLFSVCESMGECRLPEKKQQDKQSSSAALPSQRPQLEAIRTGVFECLAQIGQVFANLELAFASTRLATPCKARRIDCWGEDAAARLGTHAGQAYMNTWENDDIVTPEQRRAAYKERVAKFLDKGSFSNIIELKRGSAGQGALSALVAEQWYDYVVMLDLSVRCYPARRRGCGLDALPPKCGHTLLACPSGYEATSSESTAFVEEPVLMAGDLIMALGADDIVEALVLTSNSGHYKPRAEDLVAAVPAFERLGVARKNICLFGGPNYVRAIHQAASSVQAKPGSLAEGPPEPRKLLALWMEQS